MVRVISSGFSIACAIFLLIAGLVYIIQQIRSKMFSKSLKQHFGEIDITKSCEEFMTSSFFDFDFKSMMVFKRTSDQS